MPATRSSALFVDLDGTLVSTDILWEVFLQVVRRQPWVALLAPLWLLRGRAVLKDQLSRRAEVNAAALPYRSDVLDYVRGRRDGGDRVVLATASARRWATNVAAEVGVFDDVLASDATRNLKGSRKLAAIRSYCAEHGISSWGYVGDAPADCAVWDAADEVVMVAPSARLLSRVRAAREPTRILGDRVGRLRPIVRALRPHQWAKNALLFVPLLLARQFADVGSLLATVAAVAAFSLCASGVYVLNDLLDVESDRMHPRKRKRPFAAGTLPLAFGPPLAMLVTATGFAIALAFLPVAFAATLALYLVATSLYSTLLKRMLLVDVMVLAGLYTLRIFAGGVAAGVTVSPWLLAFSIFLFTSLAFAKRFVELSRLDGAGTETIAGRGYRVGDVGVIASMGPTSGYLAVLVFALYINAGLPAFYTRVWLLWLTCPLVLYWISRLWFLAQRRELHDDPVVFALTDKVSLGIGAAAGLLVLFAGSFA